VKQGSKKKHSNRQQGQSVFRRLAGIGQWLKKKRRKKLDAETRVHAVLVAAVLILAAIIASITVLHLNSAKPGNETTLVKETLPETRTPPEKAPEPVTQETAPAEKTPVEKAPAVTEPAPQINVPQTTPPQATTTPARPAPVEKAPAMTTPARNPEPVRPATTVSPAGGVPERPIAKGALAIVIDDAGNNLRDLDPFLKFPGPLTIAVLPGLANSAEAARRIRAAGKEVFLHQPMESLGGTNPGPGAIRAGMDREEIKAIVNRNLDEIWPVAGINNHEGSRVTMDEEAMETVLAICRDRGIVFLDSRTTAETAAPRAAKRLGIIIGERDVFIDNVQERESMLGYINTGLTKAEQNGSAIMIGHVSSPALAPLLAELYPQLSERGFPFSPASKIIGLRQQTEGIKPGTNP